MTGQLALPGFPAPLEVPEGTDVNDWEESKRDQLVTLLSKHNWAYEHADHDAWRRGRQQRAQIEHVARQLPGELVRELWREHAERKADGRFFWGPPAGRGR